MPLVHKTLPVFLFKHISSRRFSFATACVRKSLSPPATGVELPRSGNATFHFTFFVVLHSTGRFVSSVMPSRVGPRHAGQFAAGSDEVAIKAAAMRWKSRAVFMVRNEKGRTHRPPPVDRLGSALHIEAEQQLLVPQIELAVAHDGMRPDLASRIPLRGLWLELEAAMLFPAIR